jgi:hypothetical protein
MNRKFSRLYVSAFLLLLSNSLWAQITTNDNFSNPDFH